MFDREENGRIHALMFWGRLAMVYFFPRVVRLVIRDNSLSCVQSLSQQEGSLNPTTSLHLQCVQKYK